MCMKSIYIIMMMTVMLNLKIWSLILLVKQSPDELGHTALIT